MEEKGIKISIIADGYLHFCVTPAFIDKSTNVDKFIYDFIHVIRNIDHSKINKTNPVVRLYSSADIATNPFSDKFSLSVIPNMLFGKIGLSASIREHFLSLLNIKYT
jgi:hypothetical protein